MIGRLKLWGAKWQKIDVNRIRLHIKGEKPCLRVAFLFVTLYIDSVTRRAEVQYIEETRTLENNQDNLKEGK